MSTFLALAGLGTPELVALVSILTLKWVAPILVVIWMVRKLVANDRENKRLRLEVSKLAHELEQSRTHTLQTGSRNSGAAS